MNNFELSLPLVDGSMSDIYYGETSGIDVIHELITDDFGAPPRSMLIQIKTDSGKTVKISIPYDDSSNATVHIDNDQL